MAGVNPNFQGKLDSFFSKVNDLDTTQKLGVFFGTIVLIAAAYLWFFYLPQKNEIERLENKQSSLSSQVLVARSKVKRINKIKEELKNRQEEFVVVMKALPDTKEIPGLLSSLSSSASEAGLSLESIAPGKELEKGFYSEIPISMKIIGGFHETALFFDKVSNFNRIVDFKNAKLTMGKDNNISTDCRAVTYRFLKDKKNEDKKNSKKKKK
ncbi:MAG: type 4a pilus biogenesis protein PilO [Desulforegulaceae bacterium]|nr:type 4a pilus biogenesis protein PilO [Desulforegulaceae bacterium]